MKGIEIIENYFYEKVLPIIKENFDVKIAAGIIGYGSECYGFDDHLSRDHDFTSMPCIWLSHDDFVRYGKDMQEKLNELEDIFDSEKTNWFNGRRGILDIDEYIYSFLGSEDGPDSIEDFRNIPTYLLSAFTNGKIFIDEFGKITSIREKVKKYPKDIKYNMIATRCMKIPREGYHNYERCIKRNDYVAANQALAYFISSAMEMYFLIYDKYSPYYKWQHRMLKDIDIEAYNLFSMLISEQSYQKKINIIDKIISNIIDKLEENDIIVRITDYLGYYGPVIQSRIENENIKKLGCWRD